MIEEPYRWVEAIANRRDYIEGRLSAGAPIVAVSCGEGILLVTFSKDHQKLFEVYDRIAMGAMGHPGDIERLRVTTIELASTEGFTRTPLDVSLRRIVNFGLSPSLKAAFEQVYGPPFIARLLFAELGRQGPESDLLTRVDYDGSVAGNGATFARGRRHYAVVSGKEQSMLLMEKLLAEKLTEVRALGETFKIALDALLTGYLAMPDEAPEELPSQEQLQTKLAEVKETTAIEAVLLDRNSKRNITYRTFTREEIDGMS